MLRALVVLLLAATLAVPAPARAGWATPAAGQTQSGDPEVIFTFDDGPDAKHTEKVLDALAAHDVSAVFFVVGWRFQRGDLARSRRLLARMLDEGHIVANHTMTHAQLCGLAPEPLDKEIGQAREILEREAAMPVPWFRTPYGAHCGKLVEALGRHDLAHFHWDIDPQEWQGKSAKVTAAFVIRQLARLNGRAVILMHDTKPATAAALPEILSWLRSENARREAIGRRPIRVLSGADLAAEQAKPTLAWIARAADAGRDRLGELLAATVP